MKLSELKFALRANPDKPLRFVLPDGDAIPAQFHVTEVGHVAKHFIDCGGTTRRTSVAQLQLWLGSDREHRLTSTKLAKILHLADDILPTDDLDVEVEYEDRAISQYPVASAVTTAEAIEIILRSKHTDCLAKQTCGTEPAGVESACCGAGCCA